MPTAERLGSLPTFDPWNLCLFAFIRIKVKKGLHVTAARPAQPDLWTAKLERFKGSKHHTTLITCQKAEPTGLQSRWASPEGVWRALVLLCL